MVFDNEVSRRYLLIKLLHNKIITILIINIFLRGESQWYHASSHQLQVRLMAGWWQLTRNNLILICGDGRYHIEYAVVCWHLAADWRGLTARDGHIVHWHLTFTIWLRYAWGGGNRWSPHLLSSCNTHLTSRIKATKIEYHECGFFLSASQYTRQTRLTTESVVASEKLDNDINCPYTRMDLWSLIS